MYLLLNIVYLLFGIGALYYGAEWLVGGGASIAKRAGVSPLIIGLTLVAFGTSMPEFVVSTQAALDGTSDISLGNIVGSNMCNIALILGLCGCISPMPVARQIFYRDAPIMLLATILLFVFYFMGKGIARWQATVFLLIFASYLAYTIYKSCRNRGEEADEYELMPAWKSILLIIAGLGLLLTGARAFLWGAVYFAKLMHISDAVIGLTIVAVGTSLPELATSVVAALKGENGIAIGNVIGSNIFNILLILGATPLISPLSGCTISVIDMSCMALVSAMLFIFMRMGWKISRLKGAMLLSVYVGYTAYLVYQCC